MRNRRLFVTVVTLLLAAGAFFANPSQAITQDELRTEFAASLTHELPVTAMPFEGDLTRRQALQTAVEALGLSKELQLFEILSMIPELQIEDSLATLVQHIIPRVDMRFVSEGDTLLSPEDANLLKSWVSFCTKKLTLGADFVHPNGTELRVLRKNAGYPGTINDGALEARPLFSVTLVIDPKQYCGRIAATEAMGLGKKAPLSQIAADVYGCVAAVNGGYFAMDVYSPIGILKNESVMLNEKVWPRRSAVCWNESGEVCFVAGREVGKLHDKNFTDRYSQAFQAGPLLLQNAQKCNSTEDIHVKVLTQRHPRTILGTDGNKLYVTIIDGRDALHSVGTTIEETKTVCRELGMKDALNLDGGGSSELWWLGNIVNFPSEKGVERPLPYAIVFKVNEEGY